MKRIIPVFLSAVLLILSACGNKIEPTPTPPPTPAPTERISEEPGTIKDYFPVKDYMAYEYDSDPANYAEQQIYNTYTNGNRLQRRVATLLGCTTEVIEVANGEMRLVYGDILSYCYEDMTGAVSNLNYLLLKEPLVVGQQWEMYSGIACEITDMKAKVSTESGDYEAMEVTTRYSDGTEQKDYYAKGVGLVRVVYPLNESVVTISLKNITENAGIDLTVDFFFLDDQMEGLVKEERTIQLRTNQNLAKVFEDAMKSPMGESYGQLINDDTHVNYISVERDSSLCLVDLSKDFIEKTNVGSGGEVLLLQGIADTIGNFYMVDKVKITIDGKDYESGHIVKGENDYLIVEKHD